MPHTVTIEKTLFKFDELDDSAKEKALNYFRESACDDSYWYESIYEDCAAIFDILGISSEKPVKLMNGSTRYEPAIWFSGFCSQGDGACFEGSYSYKAGSCKKIREHAPQDSELHSIADDLRDLQRKAFYSLSATVKHSGHYYHEYCTSIDVEDSRRPYGDTDSDTEKEMSEILRRLMKWIYRQLESEYEYQTSDETLAENIRANDYDFDESGNLE
jgi:hypothetical protein